MAYTPGVARICQAIADDPASAWNLTVKQNTVAVVSDGTAVLGLGDIGPEAAMPVMEGKAILSKSSAESTPWPLCLATSDPDEIVAVCKAIAPGFGGINLEDILAPRCFEIEARLREEPTSPSSTTTSTAPRSSSSPPSVNALKVVGKRIEDVKIVTTGIGAAGIAHRRALAAGARRVVGCDREVRSTAAVPASRRTRRPSPIARIPRTRAAAPTRRSPEPTSSSASRHRVPSRRPRGRWRRTRSSSRWPIRRPRSYRRSRRRRRRRHGGVPTT